MSGPLLQLEHVSMRFAGLGGAAPTDVLTDINLTAAAGDTIAITGPSGCGKSTLLNIIGTLDRPASGHVMLEDVDLATLNDEQLAAVRCEKIGFIFQDHHLLPQCTVLENVLIPTLAAHEPSSQSFDRATALLEVVGLASHMHHRPGQLSGGQRQRAAVVRALINRPKLLLADEPTGSLDRDSAAQLADLLLNFNRTQHVTLILVTHAPDLARQMDRVIELDGGVLRPAKG